MKVLLTNDDGIEAEGLRRLAEAFRERHETAVVAPDRERSAVSHAVTLRRRLRPVRLPGPDLAWSLDGTPADCVKLAVHVLLPWRPDFVVSGVNRGLNVGIDVLYSGTVAGALEGTAQGVPSIAVSVEAFRPPDFRPAARFARALAESLEACGLPRGAALNVNFPARDPAQILGALWTRQVGSLFRDTFRVETDEAGRPGYCLEGEINAVGSLEPGSDAWAVREGYVSVTPLGIDLTSCGLLREIRDSLPSLGSLRKSFDGA
ncbi:MAG: 5'/3'-nucleotidase SurE [Planctomycetes bacterium]|nr:5'/3'-nucleotidase SurE [Planctomycetota bacterium]